VGRAIGSTSYRITLKDFGLVLEPQGKGTSSLLCTFKANQQWLAFFYSHHLCCLRVSPGDS